MKNFCLKYIFVIVFVLQVSVVLYAQDIRINEVVLNNSITSDEDGNSPDWFELYNYGNTPIALHNWKITDDESDLSKWSFPDIELYPNEYIYLWASSKDINTCSYPRTIIKQFDVFKYIIPTSEPSASWTSLNFNDSGWEEGGSGFGYADGDDETIVPEGTKSVFVRKTFIVEEYDDISSLILHIDYDDGFVAYINGIEVARANIEGYPPEFDDGTPTDHEGQMSDGDSPDQFDVENPLDLLNDGENVLAIQVHNQESSSSDLTLIPFLSIGYSSNHPIGIQPPAILNLSPVALHTNFKLSADGETLTLSNPNLDIIDQFVAGRAPANMAQGISSAGNQVYLSEPSQGAVNSGPEYQGYIEEAVVFSELGGMLSGSINLSLSGQTPGQEIRYTTDASLPTITSTLYTSPLYIDSTTVIRASIFQPNYFTAGPFSNTYVYNSNHELDVMLLTTDPVNFFDEEYGIYVLGEEGTYDEDSPHWGANFWEDWERPIHAAYYKAGSNDIAIEFNAGVKIYGGYSRGQNEQRSLAFYARKKYGVSKFKYPFFDKLPYDEFEAFVLRNSGQDWLISSIKDAALTSLMEGSGLDYLEFQPVVTYLNGEYWGMYNMREKTNEHFLASKHGVDPDEIVILDADNQEGHGYNEEYAALLDYVENTDLSINENFNYIEEQIDISNFAVYQVAQIYYNNSDWPIHNLKLWKYPEGKWKWILYDLDFGFGPWWQTNSYWENALFRALDPIGEEYPNPKWSTLLFRQLIENLGFRNQFINRYADELNTRFLPENVISHFNELSNNIQSEVDDHYTRWDAFSIDQEYYVSEMNDWAEARPSRAKEHIMEQFDLPAMHQLTIDIEDVSQGLVELNNNLRIQSLSWSGEYFETVPVILKAIPELGYTFSHWSGASTSTESVISIDLESYTLVSPHFIETTVAPLLINEINYNSSDDHDADDWIEIYNPNEEEVDVSNWQIRDELDVNSFTFPVSTSIAAKGYLVIAKDVEDFESVFPNDINHIGDLGFGLSGGGDAVRLFNDQGILHDIVVFTDSLPWPMCADGAGPTMELINPDLDNSIAENWDCVNDFGSPNYENSRAFGIEETPVSQIRTYPNPVNDRLYITGLEEAVEMNIYNISGQLVLSTHAQNYMNVSHLESGIYILNIIKGKELSTHKLVKR
ncbi:MULTISPECIES: CotH kinase family protein [unclassified Lentimicrobium]|uniref:CotH kinase family protein n=1 Tax=unclassified Lentimicrobium TaxID=2677434 RepID=UPI001556F5D2|nr:MULTISPECIES: CotH kinase family protein [unclassified Lentimicrobium]NPD45335.1 T9SS type A sorting domain-containing protein [Lentimicrobium sp. S6]NPD84366.1 T9SS type A sorting domain-containing protein [Lentimicrobium sp. L6]